MPIPLEKIRELKYLVTHIYCPDGTASAMLLKYCLPDLDVQFVQYETREQRELKVRPNTIFADFSPHRDAVKDFVSAEAIVLDHHKTQKDVVAEFGKLGVFADEKAEPGIAGANLAFREVCKPLLEAEGSEAAGALLRRMDDLAALAGIRDTWQTQDPRWRAACEQSAALFFWPPDEVVGLAPDQWREKLDIGKVLFQRTLDTAKKIGDKCYRFTTEKGTRVALFEGIKKTSDVAEYLDTEVDLVIGYAVFADDHPKMVFSTRSHTHYDCGKFAKAHGGGGHTKAAGFSMPLQPGDPNPLDMARRVVERYEGNTPGVFSRAAGWLYHRFGGYR